MERKALGKGIGALIIEKEPDKSDKEEKILHLKPAQIKANPFQPRKDFDTESLDELVQSVKEKGIIQPIIVRRKGDSYELIAGERRLRAAGILNLSEVPAIVREAADEDSLELALIENIQRQDLNPIEAARAYQYLIDKFHLTQERISEILGKARVTITNTLRLLSLPQEIQQEMKAGRISFAHGRALLEIEDANQQRKLVQQVINEGLSVRELENMIKTCRPRKPKRNIGPGIREPHVSIMEEELQHSLATKVRISKRKKRGHILIEFYSEEDLQRIVNKLKGAK
ncbi:MAG: ParB/RepB/Spo0J family partition protein [Candidatus Omnitrophota bacterium]